eukprot:5263652-Pyramimonas_sp.AAC.1
MIAIHGCGEARPEPMVYPAICPARRRRRWVHPCNMVTSHCACGGPICRKHPKRAHYLIARSQ